MATIADISASVLGLFYTGYLPSYWVRLRGIDGANLSNLPLGGYLPQLDPNISQSFEVSALPRRVNSYITNFLMHLGC